MNQDTIFPDFDLLWDYSKPQETEQKFRELLPAAHTQPSYYAELLTQIARTLSLQRKFDEAHALLDEIEPMLTDMPRACIRYCLERGRTFNSSGQPERARPLFLQAWELGLEAKEDNYAIDAAHMMGIIEPPEEALQWNQRALEFAERTENISAKGWIGSLTNNIGWTYHGKGDFEKALECFQKNQQWHEERKTVQGLRVAKWCVARALRSLGRIEEALQKQRELLEEFTAANASDGYVSEEIGECLLALGRAEEARPHFAHAHELLSQDIWLTANEADRIARLKELSVS